jgi:hypothetical protein
MALIKNIPTLNFGIHGNRGLGFPILGHVQEQFQSYDCFLQFEGTNDPVTTENRDDILLICSDVISEIRQPNIECFLADQADADTAVLQQEGDIIIVNCD